MRKTCRILVVAIIAMAPLAASSQTIDSSQIFDRLPPARAGQWEVSKAVRLSEGPEDTALKVRPFHACIDSATARDVMKFALTLPLGCPFKRERDSWASDGTCGGPIVPRMVTNTTISGEFESEITVRSEIIEDGRLTAIQTQRARWVGPACTNGMLPGDIALGVPGVSKFNVNNPEEMSRALKQQSEYVESKFDELSRKIDEEYKKLTK